MRMRAFSRYDFLPPSVVYPRIGISFHKSCVSCASSSHSSTFTYLFTLYTFVVLIAIFKFPFRNIFFPNRNRYFPTPRSFWCVVHIYFGVLCTRACKIIRHRLVYRFSTVWNVMPASSGYFCAMCVSVKSLRYNESEQQ